MDIIRHRPIGQRQDYSRGTEEAFCICAESLLRPLPGREAKGRERALVRHTAASHALTKGLSLLQTRDLLRHASVQTTEIYLHQDAKQLAADLEKIQK